jgi:hypothetical protein
MLPAEQFFKILSVCKNSNQGKSLKNNRWQSFTKECNRSDEIRNKEKQEPASFLKEIKNQHK